MKKTILEQINSDLEAMYLFLSFITLHIKFHPGGKNKHTNKQTNQQKHKSDLIYKKIAFNVNNLIFLICF